MKHNRTEKTAGAADVFRIIDSTGKEMFSFSIPKDVPGLAMHIERPAPAPENPVKYLERAARSYHKALLQTIDQIEAVDPAAAYRLLDELFPDA